MSSYNTSVKNCQNLCSERAPRTQALRRRRHRKRETAFAISRFLWRPRIWDSMEITLQGWRG